MAYALRLPQPTDNWARVLLAPFLIFVATATDRNYQTDLWHHLARGRAIVAEGRMLDDDRFTYTIPGRHFQDCNWGWQVLSYRLYEVGGLPLVQVVNSLVLAAAMGVLVALARRRSGSLVVASAVCVCAFFGLWQLLLIRPQTFSLLLFVLLYAALEGSQRNRLWLLAAPVLLALWVNSHGGFPVGLILIGCYVLAAAVEGGLAAHAEGRRPLAGALSRSWPWALCLAASLAATLANPYGWRVYQYVLLTASTASSRRIDEWLPPGLNLLVGKVWVLSLLALLALLARSGRRPAWREVVLVCCFLPLACGSVRMVAWWLLVSAPILAVQVVAAWPKVVELDAGGRQPTRGAAVACGVLLFAAVLSLPWLERVNPVLLLPGRAHRVESDLQAVAEQLAARDDTRRVFTRFEWGEYLGWGLAPRHTVFMDGRIEIFPDEVWARYSAVTRGRGDWEDILASYGVDCLLLDTSGYHGELLPQVERSPRWRRVLEQGNAVLFVRQPDGNELAAAGGAGERPAQ
jgi:hypothetical protein